MPDLLRTVFGDMSLNEGLLVMLLFGCILFFSWAPKLGEAIAKLFDKG